MKHLSRLTPVLVVLGPTGAGKTALVLDLARHVHGEVINQDSRQVYRGMNIGTAKPGAVEQARARHHGLDLVEPDETWTLAQQQRLTYDLVARLSAQGILPMLVGGTGQYLRAVLEGWTVPEVPPQPDIRARLEAQAESGGVSILHARLARTDPVAAARIMPGDLRRIVRALEVWEVTGQPLSEQQRSEPPPYDVLLLGLSTPRDVLYARVDKRVASMLDAGLLEEIQGLLARGHGWTLPSMRTIGYGEFEPYFTGNETIEACAERVRFNTHKFIRHQDVWFRRFDKTHWLDSCSTRLLEETLELVQAWRQARHRQAEYRGHGT